MFVYYILYLTKWLNVLKEVNYMDLQELLPFLIPVVIIQFSLLGYTIYHILTHNTYKIMVVSNAVISISDIIVFCNNKNMNGKCR